MQFLMMEHLPSIHLELFVNVALTVRNYYILDNTTIMPRLVETGRMSEGQTCGEGSLRLEGRPLLSCRHL
mgnify:FL=1